MSTIGIVCEGDRDGEMIAAIINKVTGMENMFLFMQPEPLLGGPLGGGWKGVWRWCENNGSSISTLIRGAIPTISLLVIQMDCDVARKEKEAHCKYVPANCDLQPHTHPLKCEKVKQDRCPIRFPNNAHGESTEDLIGFMKTFIRDKLIYLEGEPVYISVPCDRIDAWIVAAYDGCGSCETIQDPWRSVIARTRNYHGVSGLRSDKKSKKPYSQLILRVCEMWDMVIQCCSQAAEFDTAIRSFIGE